MRSAVQAVAVFLLLFVVAVGADPETWRWLRKRTPARTFDLWAEPSVGGYQGPGDPCQQNISIAPMLMLRSEPGAEKLECWWDRTHWKLQFRNTAMLCVGTWTNTPLSHPLGLWWLGTANIVDVSSLPWRRGYAADWILEVPMELLPHGIDFAVQAIGDRGTSRAFSLRRQ